VGAGRGGAAEWDVVRRLLTIAHCSWPVGGRGWRIGALRFEDIASRLTNAVML